MAGQFLIAALTPDATEAVVALYRAAATAGGLSRRPDEIDADNVRPFLVRAQSDGISRAAFAPDGTLVGEIHALRMTPAQFSHVLTDLTVAVHPTWQGRGLGSLLFAQMIAAARSLAPPIRRIELMAREGNADAIRLYQRLGFKIEGRFAARVHLPDGRVEDDIAMALLL
ncbi:MAG TPA: GNAT family N-acetyltransferase [Rhizomicrobium sp.]|jgi:ribosomal protein S18 acetylase RimI-like enzyme|nr:GNAT family N-acetyltransferase [Rhizomicrobium sp.]